MTGSKPEISAVRSNYSTNCAITTSLGFVAANYSSMIGNKMNV